MFMENGIRIDQDVIFLAFAAVEPHAYLTGRTVVLAEETFSLLYGSGINLRGSGHDSCRIELQGDLQPSEHHCPD